jgi:DNA-3-methyladenine glycosylase II
MSTSASDIEEAPAHLTPEQARAYLDARIQGLCHDGALEVALGVPADDARDEPPRQLNQAWLRRGVEALRRRDAQLAAVVDRIGAPPLWARQPGFPTLVRIVLEQQVSLSAARTMYERLRNHVGAVTPETIGSCGVDGMRRLGFTRQKAAYCHGLAESLRGGHVDLRAIARAPDDEGRRALLQVRGLGPWSVDIYYLMALRRPDIWPRGDLALAVSVREIKGLASLPARDEQLALAERWAPWRSVAARILWAHYLAARGQYSPAS